MSETTWQTRVRELRATGMFLRDIGKEIGLSTSAVGDLASGYHDAPRGDAAIKLHALHLERCSKPAKKTTRKKT